MDKLRSLGVDVSINLTCTLGHSDFHQDLRKLFPFQFQVDITGVESKACACPLDDKWRRHISKIYRIYASLKPRVIWVDDDFRLHNHSPVRWGCFCPLHLKMFAERYGERLTREDLVKAVLKPDSQPTEERRIWLGILGDTMIDAAAVLERAVHEVSPETRIGIMTSSPEVHSAEGRRWRELLKALSGPYKPIIRPPLGNYSEGDKRLLLRGLTMTLHTKALVPREAEICPEVENWPYTRFSKSAKFTWLQIALCQLHGIPDVTLNLYGWGAPLNGDPEYARMLKEAKIYFQSLTRISLQDSVFRGIRLFFHESGALYRDTEGRSWEELIPKRPWDMSLPLLGFSVTYEESGICAVSGDSILALSDEELKELLRRNLILDASAAKALCRRGLSHLIGVDVGKKILNGYAEEILDEEFGKRPGKARTFIAAPLHNLSGVGWLRELKPLPDARVVSQILGVNGDKLSDGLVLFENELGGKVAVFPYDGQSGAIEAISFRNWVRQSQLKATVNWLTNGKIPFFVEAVDVVPVRIDQPGRVVLSIANLSSDTIINLKGIIGDIRGENYRVLYMDRRGRLRRCGKASLKNYAEAAMIQIKTEIEPLGLRVFILEEKS